ncbi:hypothetical protein [Brevibacillus formosus]|uniref:hypothetical protein n=1 Tax=Brevibacillus formosus TaxID=54913 RepID=UPI003F1B2E15
MNPITKLVKRVKVNGRDVNIVGAEVELHEVDGVIDRYVLTFESKSAVKEALDLLTDSKRPPSEIEFVLHEYAEAYKGRSYIKQTSSRLKYTADGYTLEKIK